MEWIVNRIEHAGAAELGGKGHALASAQLAGMAVPRWFAITPAAAEACRTEAGVFVIPPALRNRMVEAAHEHCSADGYVAVRSSAVDEDGATTSFAGQLESFLFVRPQDVPARVLQVWRSASADHVLAYRRQHGLPAVPTLPAVLVQRMIAADAAGVAFSADPVSGQRAVTVVAAVLGVAAGLVSGEQNAETWRIDRSGAILGRPGGGAHPCLSDSTAVAVARLARRSAHHFGSPQDIEWAYSDGALWLLQSRPITSLASLPDPDGAPAVWDSSNIGESYSGVTTPLTFSFIRRGYMHAYRELCRVGGVDAATIRSHDDVFGRMIGLIAGRVHYNLLGWYRLLALSPGYERNRRFLDEMLGIRGQVGHEITGVARQSGASALRLLRTARQLVALGFNHWTVERRNQRFRARLDAALARPPIAFEDMRADELAGQYRLLERALLAKWDAPLVNDFLAMIFHGMLRRLVERWFPPSDHGLVNDLLAGEPGIISVEPVRRIRLLAHLASGDDRLVALLCGGTASEALLYARTKPEFHAAYEDYLDRFGERCLEELKLESATLYDDPLPLLRAIGHFASGTASRQPAKNNDVRGRAGHRVSEALAWHPLRRMFFNWVLRNARARVRDRENLRFERTRVFGRVRRIFVEIGRRFREIGALDSHRDIYWLDLEDILGYIDGTVTCTNLRGLTDLRKAEFARHRECVAPDRRFETAGIAYHGGRFRSPVAPAPHVASDERRATGCCPGRVRGRARVVRSPEQAQVRPGEILVAERTDPGWVMLFASAAGLVIEHGSLLSHAAIVARELGIPAVIGVPDACNWLADGDLIEIDGTNGAIRRLGTSDSVALEHAA
jgi:pyruvate,water dikinase